MGAVPTKILHTIVFDVSGSMQSPLKLRSNAQDANKGSEDLQPKRVQTVFDIIVRLAEDCIAEANDKEIEAAVLCFGLRTVPTCDLLALMTERTKVLEMLDGVDVQSTSELPYAQAAALLSRNSLSTSFLKSTRHTGREQLYTVYGHAPLITLLGNNGAPYCEKYVHDHTTPESAGKYFMAFASPERRNDLRMIVERLPQACKEFFSASRFLTNNTGALGSMIQGQAASEAISHADELMAKYDAQAPTKKDVQTILRSIPNASPQPIQKVVDLIKRLRSALDAKQQGGSAGTVNWERLLDDIEPYLYGGTPMCQALRSILPLFQSVSYSPRTMVLISDGESTDGDPLPHAETIRSIGGIIYACLLTDSHISEPRRLWGVNERRSTWSEAAKVMFEIASTASNGSGAVQTLRRRGWILPASGQCKLFIQANNPSIIDEFASASRVLTSNSDALADMIGEISLDDYIRSSHEGAKATRQEGPICWAHATASVIHLASRRVVGRNVQSFNTIRDDLLRIFGNNDDGQSIGPVLDRVGPRYRLHYKKCNEEDARAAIHARRPVIAAFHLQTATWDRFSSFYQRNPKGVLKSSDLFGPSGGHLEGHAVVLIRCDENSLTFMNSWGPQFGNNGFFTIDRASTLEESYGPCMLFYDVYWTTDDLTPGEIASWKEYTVESGEEFIGRLPKSFHDLPVTCPFCKNVTEAKRYEGTWNEARCASCRRTFAPTVKALVRTLYESNYDG